MGAQGYQKPQIRLEATNYSFTRAQIDELLEFEVRQQLKIPSNKKVKLNWEIREVGGDPLDRFPGHNDVTGLSVTIS